MCSSDLRQGKDQDLDALPLCQIIEFSDAHWLLLFIGLPQLHKGGKPLHFFIHFVGDLAIAAEEGKLYVLVADFFLVPLVAFAQKIVGGDAEIIRQLPGGGAVGLAAGLPLPVAGTTGSWRSLPGYRSRTSVGYFCFPAGGPPCLESSGRRVDSPAYRDRKSVV